MKKQFFRVKQLADQRFSRAEKTEALSYGLHAADKRIDFIRNVCILAGKKLGVAPPSGHDPNAFDKRLKKNPEYSLGQSLIELASRQDDDHLLRQIVTDCGKLQMGLGRTIVSHEISIEKDIIEPLMAICETDYPNIIKQKKNLNKLILDMDSARTRYQQATKHGGSAPPSKVDNIKEEWEEAETKVDQCRDALACEIFQLISREAEISKTFMHYARLQRNMHNAAGAYLDSILTEMEDTINQSSVRPVFGESLEDHLRVTNRKIAYPIELCVCGILELTGTMEEGLFRVAPGASKLKRMKLSLDANCLELQTALAEYRDPHVFAGVLKSYLRELPEPLLTNKLYDQWMAAARIVSSGKTTEGLNALRDVIQSLPQENYDNLHYLVKFFASLANRKDTNKMTPQNIAIVIAPNLIWTNEDGDSLGVNMNVAALHSCIVVTLVSHADFFFPGDIEFFITLHHEPLNRDETSSHNGLTHDHHNETQPVGIKRAQSNDSLSDHNSPPQGSPKPAIRSRKHKSTAPTPPVHLYNKENKNHNDEKPKDKQEKRNSIVKDDRKSKLIEEPKQETKSVKLEKKSEVKENKKEDAETQIPVKANICVGEEIENIQPAKFNNSLSSFNEYHFGTNELENCGDLPERKIGELDKRTSKSGEDVRKVKLQEGIYATMERKKPPRPTPAPRTFMEGDKVERPAIPERPANLQRPQSLSFRMVRPSPDSPDGDGRSLERAHMYSLEKKQVAIVHIPSDKVPTEKKPGETVRERRESGEKPEKPKKPESLVCQSGHQRAASEGSIIDTGLTFERRPPRPTPPPPPVTSPTRKESTDL